ncbi:MAG: SDR family oxidoreductase [Pseudomonadota bacterium]
MFQSDVLKGERILVTGGGTGLGRSMTEGFLKAGAHCTIWGRRGEVLEETAAELREQTGGEVDTKAVNIRDAEAIDAAVAEGFEKGGFTGLVNNAAGNFISPTEALSANAFNSIASTVFHGTFNVTNAVGKRWIGGGKGGSILSIVTTWVWTGSAFVVPSAMSKAGVAAMTQSLAVEWGPKGIRANAIAPGPFPTKGAWDRLMPKGAAEKVGDISGEESVPMRRVGKHEELANLAVFLMAPGAAYINGAVVPIDGGQYLNSAGTFAGLSALEMSDWMAIRDTIQATNAADKAKRST